MRGFLVQNICGYSFKSTCFCCRLPQTRNIHPAVLPVFYSLDELHKEYIKNIHLTVLLFPNCEFSAENMREHSFTFYSSFLCYWLVVCREHSLDLASSVSWVICPNKENIMPEFPTENIREQSLTCSCGPLCHVSVLFREQERTFTYLQLWSSVSCVSSL